MLRSESAPVPVICVGNLTTGGTGKTPMVAWVVEHLKRTGRSPAVLTRGYRAVDGLADEAELLRTLTGAPVVVDPDRLAGAARATADPPGRTDVLVMDDGFQHRRLRRDLDVVLIDAANPFGFGHCLPRGLMREPPSALADAQAVVVTRSDAIDADALDRLRSRLARLAPGASLHAAVHRPSRVLDEHGAALATSALAGRRALAFCGIAWPESFFAALAHLGVRLVGQVALEDHVAYTPAVLARIAEAAQAADAPLLLTTEKDAVKLTGKDLGLPLWRLAVEMEITEGRDELLRLIDEVSGLPSGRP